MGLLFCPSTGPLLHCTKNHEQAHLLTSETLGLRNPMLQIYNEEFTTPTSVGNTCRFVNKPPCMRRFLTSADHAWAGHESKGAMTSVCSKRSIRRLTMHSAVTSAT